MKKLDMKAVLYKEDIRRWSDKSFLPAQTGAVITSLGLYRVHTTSAISAQASALTPAHALQQRKATIGLRRLRIGWRSNVSL